MTGRIKGSKNTRMHKWTDEQYAFLTKVVAGRSHREIHALVTERFGITLTVEQVKAAISRKKLNTGRTGQFVKGQVPVRIPRPCHDEHRRGEQGMSAPTSVWLGVIVIEGNPLVKAVLWSEPEAEAWLNGVEAAYTTGYTFEFDMSDKTAIDLRQMVAEVKESTND